MRYEPIGLARFAKFDMSISRMRIARHKHVPSAAGALTYCLLNFDMEAAEIIYQAQRQVTDEKRPTPSGTR